MTHSSCVFKRVTILKWQWSKAAAMLGDYKTFIETWGLAVNSAGFAAGQIGVQIDTLARRIEKLKADMQGLAVDTGNAGITKYLKEELGGLDSVILGLKQLDSTQVKIIAGSTLLILGIASVASVMRSYALATEEAATATTRLGKASKFASKWNLVVTALTVASFVLGSYLEKLGDAAEAERQVTEQQDNNIAKANQQLDMYKQQDDFIGTLISAHKKMQEQLDSGSLSDEKAIAVKKNMQSTLEELTKVTGDDGLAQLVAAGNYEEASGIEKQAYQSKSDEIKNQIKNLRAQQIDYTKSQIQATQDRIDALQSETSAWDIWSRVVQKAMGLYAGYLDTIIASQEWINTHVPTSPEGQIARENALNETKQKRESLKNFRPEGVQEEIDRDIQKLEELKIKVGQLEISSGIVNYQTPPPGGSTVTDDSKPTGAKYSPMDKSSNFDSKVDKFQLDSTIDKAKSAADRYKSVLATIDDMQNRLGSSYGLLDQRISAMNKHMVDLQGTIASLADQSKGDLAKINELASETGATITVSGANIGNTEGSTWNRETGSVDIEGLQQNAMDAISAVSQKFYELTGQQMIVSSGMRTWGGHVSGQKFDIVDSASSELLESNASGIRDAIIEYAQSIGLSVMDEYRNPSANATAGHLDFDASSFAGGSHEVTIEGLGDVLSSHGVSQDEWNGYSKDQKLAFARQYKEEINNGNELIGYLERLINTEKKIAEYQKQYAEEKKKVYEAALKGLNDIEEYQGKLSDLKERTVIASYGISITDVQRDKAELQKLLENKQQLDDWLKNALGKGIDVNSYDYKSKQVISAELQNKIDTLRNIKMPKDSYEYTKQNIDWRQNMAIAMTPYSGVMTYQDELNAKIKATEETAVALKKALEDMMLVNKNAMDTQPYKQYEQQLESVQKELKHLKDTTYDVRKFTADSFLEMANDGTKLKDIMKNVWRDIEKEALYAFMGIRSGSASIGNSIMKALGFFNTGGSKVNTTYSLGTSYASSNPYSLSGAAFHNAEGSIGNKEQLSWIREGNKREAIIPLEDHKDRGRSLVMASAKELGMLGGVGVEPFLKNPGIAQQAVNVTVQKDREHLDKLDQQIALNQQMVQMMLHMINNPSGGNTALQPIVLQQGISMDQLSTMISKGQSTRQIK